MPVPKFKDHLQINSTFPIADSDDPAEVIIDLGKKWQARYLVVRQSGVLVVKELTVKHAGTEVPLGGLTARLLRKVKFNQPKSALVGFRNEIARRMPAIFGAIEKEKRKGRSEFYFAMVARAYCDAIASGARNPAHILGLKLNEPPVRMRHIIWQVRKRGLLSHAKVGAVPSADQSCLTAKAREIIEKSSKTARKEKKR